VPRPDPELGDSRVAGDEPEPGEIFCVILYEFRDTGEDLGAYMTLANVTVIFEMIEMQEIRSGLLRVRTFGSI